MKKEQAKSYAEQSLIKFARLYEKEHNITIDREKYKMLLITLHKLLDDIYRDFDDELFKLVKSKKGST